MITAHAPKTITSTPGIRTQGHLALLEWDEMPTATAVTAAPTRTALGTYRKSVMDHCYDGGTLVLLAVTVAALAESLCRF